MFSEFNNLLKNQEVSQKFSSQSILDVNVLQKLKKLHDKKSLGEILK